MAEKRTPGHSLEDMLEQLETAERDYEGKPQILDDGRIRVKKRKRRSEQKVHKKRRNYRNAKLALASFLLLALLATWLLNSRTKAMYEGDEFAKNLQQQLSRSLEADVTLEGLATQRGNIYLNQLSIANPRNSTIALIELKNLSAKIHPWAWLKKNWKIKRLHADEAQITVQDTVNTTFPQEANDDTSEDIRSALNILNLQKVEIDNFSLYWSNGKTTNNTFRTGQIEGALLYGSASGSGWDVHLREGIYNRPKSPPIALMYANGYAGLDKIILREAKLKHGEVEEAITLKGEISNLPGATTKIDIAIRDLPSSQIFNKPWSKWIDADLVGDFRYSHTHLENAAPSLKGFCTLKSVHLTGVPGLDIIASTTNDPLYEDMELNGPIQFDYFWTEDQIFLKSLTGNLEGTFSLKGDINWQAERGELAGKLMIGLHDDAFAQFQGGVPPFFTTSLGEGLRWAKVELGGHISNPTNTLRDQLASLKQEKRVEHIEPPVDTITDTTQPSISNESTNSPESIETDLQQSLPENQIGEATSTP